MEQRYQAVSLVIHDGESVVEVARWFNVSRQTVHAWLARYERGGLAALADRSHRPKGCKHQMPAAVEAVVLEMRRINPDWGPRRLLHELAREGIDPLPSRSGIYRLLRRQELIDPTARRRRDRKFKRWERGTAMELWQMDVVGVVCVAWQQISVGKHRAGRTVDIHVGPELLHIWDGNELLKTVLRDSTNEVRKKRASVAS